VIPTCQVAEARVGNLALICMKNCVYMDKAIKVPALASQGKAVRPLRVKLPKGRIAGRSMFE
jgi:hypothetical protein